MGPAVWIPGSGGIITAHAATAAARVDPDGVPSGGRAIVQNNGVALGTGEGALTDDGTASSDIGAGEAVKSQATVGGDRCAGDVDWGDVTAS